MRLQGFMTSYDFSTRKPNWYVGDSASLFSGHSPPGLPERLTITFK